MGRLSFARASAFIGLLAALGAHAVPMAVEPVHQRDVFNGADAAIASSGNPPATTSSASDAFGVASATPVSDTSGASAPSSTSSASKSFLLAAKLIDDESKSDLFTETEYLSC